MIGARDIIRGALTRTLPATLLGFAVLVGLSTFARSNISLSRLALTATAGLAAAAGSALMLLALRRRLRADAGVTGRRAFLVGLGAFGVMVTVRPFLSNIGTPGEYLLMGVSGATLAAAVFFPWLGSSAADEGNAHIGVTGPQAVITTGPLEISSDQRSRSVADRDHDA